MKLIVHEIISEVFQTMVSSKNTMVGVVRPHLYIKNRPSGKLRVEIHTPDGALLGASNDLLISSITSANEYHGYVSFYVDAFLMANKPYVFKVVSSSGYSFDESAYCGCCATADLKKYPQLTPVSFLNSHLDLEIWSLSQK